MTTTTPTLERLAGVYLNEDWVFDYKTWQGAVDAFASDSPEEIPLLQAEIQRVLVALDSEGELRDYLFSLGMAFDADSREGGYRGWLTEIARRVAAATN